MTEWVGLDWLKEQTNYQHPQTLKKHILIPYKDELEGFIYYPKVKGERWRISKKHMEEWLRNNVV